MTPIDYDAWLAVRVIGEAASRKQTSDFKTLNTFIHSPEFEVAAFKGVKTTFRAWNGQLRQPLIVLDAEAAGQHFAAARLPASVHRTRHARHR